VIRVVRGGPPSDASTLAQSGLETARDRHSQGLAVRRDDLPDTYRRWSDLLARQQHHKCCYCECVEQTSRNDVEHYRPAGSAQRTKGHADPGYWWLAYTWTNLLFSCAHCNQSAKNDWFPLEQGSVPLSPEQPPPGQERPVLIDPAVDRPLEHIKFESVQTPGAPTRWYPTALTKRGQENITLLKLARQHLLDLYGLHVRTCVEPDVALVRQGRLSRSEVCDRLLIPERPFTALSAWVLAEQLGGDFVAEAKQRGC
jgi:uncharacterized protein (TIGR02646 family)